MIIPNTIFGAPSGDILGGAGAITSLAGGIIGGIGALQAGNAQAQGYLNNMAVAGEQAAQELFQFNRQRQAQQYQENRLIGRQRALYGAGGVSAGGGSPLDVMGDTANQIKLQALNLAYAKRFAQTGAAEQGNADIQAAQAAKEAASTNFFGDIIGGIGSAAKLALAAL
jgi:hypothetical protein